MNAPLTTQIAIAKAAMNLVLRAGVDPDDPDLIALVESESDAFETLRRMLRAARMAEANAKALKDMLAEMQDRRTRFEEKAEGLRRAVSWALQELGQSRLEAPDFTATLAKGRAPIQIINEALLPDDLCRIRREPDKTKIREHLETTLLPLEGAMLGNPAPTLTVRCR